MASSPLAIPNLTCFKDRSGSRAVLRARLGAKVLYQFNVPERAFKGNTAELNFQELSPKSASRAAAVQGPLERRTCVPCPRDYATHMTQLNSVFPGDLVVRSSASGKVSRELVLVDLFERFPAAVRELRMLVFDRSSRGGAASEPLPWFGTRCALVLLCCSLCHSCSCSCVTDALAFSCSGPLLSTPMARPSRVRSSTCTSR